MEKLVRMWLEQRFSLNRDSAARAIHSLKRDRVIYEEEGFLKLEKDDVIDGMAHMKSKALRVVLKFLPSGFVFDSAGFPFLFSFIHDGLLVQVAYIMRGSEAADSLLMCSEAPLEQDRKYIRRIAVLEDPSSARRVKRCGISLLCTVNEELEARVFSRRELLEAWRDAA